MDEAAMRERLAGATVAHLATADEHGRPHLVPICFALERNTLYFAVDAKPKRTTKLKRLKNVAANPRVSVLVDHYEDDWSRLWWVRVDGAAHELTDPAAARSAVDLLVKRYSQYRRARPGGPVVAITIESITGWTAADNPAC
ncbi:MAG TPA: TIGR03668 family PPOX class F420-dependent oxidoreductase [Candidatus Dormibacteraeota bacterium]|nr:TIGR03668 family PPOX class F420-dependent oxidoreductase [Candidatus Dormibacteraeota bacterium]